MTLHAECSNCAAWQKTPDMGHATSAGMGFCGKGLFPPQGEPLCQQYEASHAFKQQIISTMLKEQGPMALPVKLVGGKKSARAINKKLKERRR